MSTEDLVKKFEADDYLLPADIRKQVSDEELLKELEEIFANTKYQKKLKTEDSFRRKYLDTLAYLISENLNKKTKLKFNDDMIATLLSYPEAA